MVTDIKEGSCYEEHWVLYGSSTQSIQSSTLLSLGVPKTSSGLGCSLTPHLPQVWHLHLSLKAFPTTPAPFLLHCVHAVLGSPWWGLPLRGPHWHRQPLPLTYLSSQPFFTTKNISTFNIGNVSLQKPHLQQRCGHVTRFCMLDTNCEFLRRSRLAASLPLLPAWNSHQKVEVQQPPCNHAVVRGRMGATHPRRWTKPAWDWYVEPPPLPTLDCPPLNILS